MSHTRILMSPFGLGLVMLMVAGFVIQWQRTGGQMFSPGELSAMGSSSVRLEGFANHAEFERECDRCHQPLDNLQGDLCVVCHVDVADQIATVRALHGPIPEVMNCKECHPDHLGRDKDLASLARGNFDHNLASFTLLKHQVDYTAAPMQCEACHLVEDYAVSMNSCAGCHQTHDPAFMQQHLLDFGLNCLECHDGGDRLARFDHRATTFPLDGQHAQVRCVDCHAGGNFETTPTVCAECHQEPDVHRGVFNPDCSLCHDSVAWTPANFDGVAFAHESSTRFSLARHSSDYEDRLITCLHCHPGDFRNRDTQTCVACHDQHDHEFMDGHVGLFGPACMDCHDGVDRLSEFAHADVFPLEGQHAEIECADCHVNKVFRGTPNQCVQCHEEPQLHSGFFGIACQNCHTAVAWAPAPLRYHTFPLGHASEEELACQACHTETYIAYTCFGCHEHQPEPIAESHTEIGISPQELPACATCHPTGMAAVQP